MFRGLVRGVPSVVSHSFFGIIEIRLLILIYLFWRWIDKLDFSEISRKNDIFPLKCTLFYHVPEPRSRCSSRCWAFRFLCHWDEKYVRKRELLLVRLAEMGTGDFYVLGRLVIWILQLRAEQGWNPLYCGQMKWVSDEMWLKWLSAGYTHFDLMLYVNVMTSLTTVDIGYMVRGGTGQKLTI